VDPEEDYVYNPVTDPSFQRLQILAKTLRGNTYLANQVNYLKLAYSVRDGVNADVTRAISACHNIMYADLPAGFYSGDPRFEVLRKEVAANCRNFRFMKFVEGSGDRSEKFFRELTHMPWPKLEYLAVDGLRIDAATFRYILAALPDLKTLVLTDLKDIADDFFSLAEGIPAFPAIENLELHNLPNMTVSGIVKFLTMRHSREALTSLTLDDTGVKIATLHSVLANATNLDSFTVVSAVERALPIDPLPPLTSKSLETFHFDITNSDPKTALSPKPTDSCHAYLLNSILSGSLPALRALYVRDKEFPSALTTAHRAGVRASSVFGIKHLGSIRLSSSPDERSSLLPPVDENRFEEKQFSVQHMDNLQQLEVYTKDTKENAWIFSPMNVDRRQSSINFGTRNSSHAATQHDSHRRESAVNMEWRANGHHTVIVGSPESGFMTVPKEMLYDPEEEEVREPEAMELEDKSRRRTIANAANELLKRKRGSWWETHTHGASGRRASAADLWR
jgi:hypothetical protein